MADKTLLIASDHAGLKLKDEIRDRLTALGLSVEDVGVNGEEPVDYPDYAEIVAERVSTGDSERGILVCGSGVGMAIAANKFPGVRAVHANDVYTAEMSRKHNDSNILALSSRGEAKDDPEEIVKTWLNTEFEGGRHQRRIDKISDIEKRIKENQI